MKKFNLEEYLKNPSQKVITRDGRNVRIICTDCKNEFKIVALVYNEEEQKESVECFYENGKYLDIDHHHLDLFFAPIKREGWINIYDSDLSFYRNIYKTKEDAINGINNNLMYLATIKIEWEE